MQYGTDMNIHLVISSTVRLTISSAIFFGC